MQAERRGEATTLLTGGGGAWGEESLCTLQLSKW